jgi:hypothetical protein
MTALRVVLLLLTACSSSSSFRYRPRFLSFAHKDRWRTLAQQPEMVAETGSKDFLVRLLVPGNQSTKSTDIMYGVIKLSEAVSLAEKMKLDLIVLNEKLSPPLYKIADEAKLAFDTEKRRKEAIKKAAKVELKEIKLSFQISDHDMDVRMKIVQRFLSQGDRVNHSTIDVL